MTVAGGPSRIGTRVRERIVLTLGCVATAWALLAGATERPPVENRGIRILRVAGATVETGDVLVPHVRGQPRFHKPPLYCSGGS